MPITGNIQSQINQKKFCTGVLIELKMTFDLVHSEILLKKLSHYGIRGAANKWFCSYQTKRK